MRRGGVPREYCPSPVRQHRRVEYDSVHLAATEGSEVVQLRVSDQACAGLRVCTVTIYSLVHSTQPCVQPEAVCILANQRRR
jgi:hypothetical protein